MPVKLVVDSSVIVKWLNQKDEANLKPANLIIEKASREEVTLITPELAKYEVGNALLFSKDITVSESKIVLSSFFMLPIIYFPLTEELSKLTYQIAKNAGVTFYDASFLALAKQENAVLVTDNSKHQGKIKGVKVVSLKDYK
jgi:predicted nucleic acid-binding protein